MLRLGAAEQLAHRDADRVHDPGDAGREPGRVGRRRRRRRRATAAPPWRVRELRSAARAASSSADGPPVPVTSAHISSKPASTKCSASWIRPLPASRRPAASAARRMMPDAQMSLKTPRSSRSRYISRASPSSSSNSARCSSGTLPRMSAIRASTSASSTLRVRRRRCGSRAAARRAARARSGRRCRSRRAAGSRRGRDTPTSPRRPRRRARAAPSSILPGSPSESRSARAAGSCVDRGDEPLELARRARRDGRRAAHQAEQLGRRDGRSSRPTCARKSPIGSIAEPVKRMCWKIICAWWSRQRVRYATSSSSESASGSTDCSSRWVLIAAGLNVSSHSRSCSRQTLRSQHLLRAREALRDLLVGRRPHRVVREAVDVRRSRASRSASRRTPNSWVPRANGRDASPPSTASPDAGSAPGRAPRTRGPEARSEARSRCLRSSSGVLSIAGEALSIPTSGASATLPALDM